MRKVYAGLPRVTVEPLLFAPDDISGERLLAMMKVDENTRKLYDCIILLLYSDRFRDAFVHGIYHGDITVHGG